ncbi:hypothetical protein OROHE_022824 [Orobanche hederae]
MSSSSHRPRQWFHLTPADKMILPPPADKSSECGNQPIDLMYSSKHRIWYYLYRAHPEGSIEWGNQVEQPIDIMNSSSHAENKGSIKCGNQVEQLIDIMNSSPQAENKGSSECGNQVEQLVDIMNSSSHHLSPAENKGNIECGNQVDKPIDIMNSSSHHLSLAENKGSIECDEQVEQPIDVMNSSSHRKRKRLSPAQNTTLDGSIECDNQVEQPIDIMNSSSQAENKGSIECGNQVEQPIDIMNSSSHSENKGSIECGTQVERPIDIVNSSSHHPPSENTTPEGSINNQVEQPINITLHGKDGHPINLVFSSSNRKWYGLTPDKKLIPSRPWYLCPQSKSAWNFLCGNQDEGQVDIFKKEKPESYKEIVHVCKFALNHYKDSHPDKPSYEFESVEKSYARADAGKSYSLTFKARNVEDGKLAVFETHAHHLFGKELEISKVELLPE